MNEIGGLHPPSDVAVKMTLATLAGAQQGMRE